MSKKVFIGVGHGGTDPGACSGKWVEANMNLIMAQSARYHLERHGVLVLMSRTKDENDPVSDEVRECNAFNPDLAMDCHNNSGGGDGFEVIYSRVAGTSLTLAKNIESCVIAIGQNSRGCKTRLNNSGKDYFAFVRETRCPAVICEGVFLDNTKDMQIADTIEEQKRFGEAYAKGALKTLGIPWKEESTSQPGGDDVKGLWAVCVTACEYNSAKAMQQELINKGYKDTYLIPR